MSKALKNAIPKSHYEITLDFLNRVSGSFNEMANVIEQNCGTEPDFVKLGNYLSTTTSSSASIENNTLYANVMFHQYNMWQAGSPIYYITPQLALELAKTELNVDTDFLMSPFREIHVQIEPGLFSINDGEGSYPVIGFYVFFNRHESGLVEVRIMAGAIISIKDGFVDDTNFYYKLYLKPGKLKPMLKEYLDSITASNKQEDLERFGGHRNIAHIEDLIYFVMNVLLYLTSKDPDIIKQLPVNFDDQIAGLKSAGKVKKLLRKKDKYTQRTINIVGPHYRLNTEEYNDMKNAGGIGGWKLKHKIKVSAHWRTQWYGSEKEGTRRSENIRIESYTKGPDAAELLTKKRIVK